MAGESPGLSAVVGWLLRNYGRELSARRRRLSSSGTRARSRRSSSMRARIAGKSSTAWDLVTFSSPFFFEHVLPRDRFLWLTGQAA